MDRTDETVGEKIRRALTHKHPFVLVVGDDDLDARTVGIRAYGEEEERGVGLTDAVERIAAACAPPR